MKLCAEVSSGKIYDWSSCEVLYSKASSLEESRYMTVKGSGGVVAKGVVAGEPVSMFEPSQYWYEEPNDEEVLKVPITASEQRVDGSYLNRLDLNS
jgi:hypothetical protein